ncbi:poly(A) polymerase gamma-like [Sabethes cyaneus]|uniref:poly(A) polymerase gamma-like n=1 Tax=Sabethes cyaneus TaxID=53552 RepID=UPI00237E87BE|nr:poly(A) polymerase gamma-like [Sabethes cyaneus]
MEFEASSFFSKYRHYIVLLATSSNADSHPEWCRLVKCNIRLLLVNLKRIPHINLAQVYSKRFMQAPNGINGQVKQLCALWFIGLEFDRPYNLNIDLTGPILCFTDAVYRQARQINLLKDGMDVEARHIRREQLREYVDPNPLQLDRNNNNAGVELAVDTSSTQNTEIEPTATPMIIEGPRTDAVSYPDLLDLLYFDL